MERLSAVASSFRGRDSRRADSRIHLPVAWSQTSTLVSPAGKRPVRDTCSRRARARSLRIVRRRSWTAPLPAKRREQLPSRSLIGEIRPRPFDQHQQSASQAYEPDDVDEQPSEPSEVPRETQARGRRHRVAAADRGHDSAITPANSTPVGPPPTDVKRSSSVLIPVDSV